MSAAHGDPVVGPEVAALVGGGVAIVAATRDAALKPELTRGWGPSVSADGRTLRLCVSVLPESRIRSNLEDNGAMAVTFVLPTTYRSVQIKGQAIAVGEPTPDELARVEEHAAAFTDQAEQVGVSRRLIRRLLRHELTSVTLAVSELYDQTPGPGAGAPA